MIQAAFFTALVWLHGLGVNLAYVGRSWSKRNTAIIVILPVFNFANYCLIRFRLSYLVYMFIVVSLLARLDLLFLLRWYSFGPRDYHLNLWKVLPLLVTMYKYIHAVQLHPLSSAGCSNEHMMPCKLKDELKRPALRRLWLGVGRWCHPCGTVAFRGYPGCYGSWGLSFGYDRQRFRSPGASILLISRMWTVNKEKDISVTHGLEWLLGKKETDMTLWSKHSTLFPGQMWWEAIPTSDYLSPNSSGKQLLWLSQGERSDSLAAQELTIIRAFGLQLPEKLKPTAQSSEHHSTRGTDSRK